MNSYEVVWQLQGDSSTGRTSVPGSSTSYTITGLRGESNYTITVTAVNVAGNATSDPVTQLTGVAGMEYSYCYTLPYQIHCCMV